MTCAPLRAEDTCEIAETPKRPRDPNRLAKMPTRALVATRAYEAVFKRYPTSVWADDAKRRRSDSTRGLELT